VKVTDGAAVVVGGASGMGRATAERLAEQGARVAVLDDMAGELTRDAAFPRRMGRPDEYAALALAIVENQMLNGSAIRLDAGQRFAPK
jgi:NADP-dependent 3-hydroxy acid dehydrogenase YdfG